jgi:hypothetical protein
VLDLLRLPDICVESLVGLVNFRQQDEQFQHIAINFELYSGEIVDYVPESLGYE